MGTNCAPLIADLFLYCYERDFMSNLQKSKRFDLIDKFNDTSRYRDDIFTIDNLAFAEIKKGLLLRCIHHFNSDKLTIWTICAFRVLNPRQ